MTSITEYANRHAKAYQEMERLEALTNQTPKSQIDRLDAQIERFRFS